MTIVTVLSYTYPLVHSMFLRGEIQGESIYHALLQCTATPPQAGQPEDGQYRDVHRTSWDVVHLPTGASCHGDLSPLHAHSEPAEPLSGKAALMKEWALHELKTLIHQQWSLVYQSFDLVLANAVLDLIVMCTHPYPCGIVYMCAHYATVLRIWHSKTF